MVNISRKNVANPNPDLNPDVNPNPYPPPLGPVPWQMGVEGYLCEGVSM